MKKTVYSLVLAASLMALLSACVADEAPGALNRKKVLWLRGDGWAIQRYETQAPATYYGYGEGYSEDDQQPVAHRRHKHGKKHHHKMKATDEAAPVKSETKTETKIEKKKEAVKKEEKKEESKKDDSKKEDKKDESKKDDAKKDDAPASKPW